jgi:hypothetical protein
VEEALSTTREGAVQVGHDLVGGCTHFRKLCCLHQRGPHLLFDGNVEERRYTTHLSVKIGEQVAVINHEEVRPLALCPVGHLEVKKRQSYCSVCLIRDFRSAQPKPERLCRLRWYRGQRAPDRWVAQANPIEPLSSLVIEVDPLIVEGHRRVTPIASHVDISNLVVERDSI